jgi:ribosome recycling factor
MMDPKGIKVSTAMDGAGVQARNAIHVLMEDLTEEDRKEVEHELEGAMASLRRATRRLRQGQR